MLGFLNLWWFFLFFFLCIWNSWRRVRGMNSKSREQSHRSISSSFSSFETWKGREEINDAEWCNISFKPSSWKANIIKTQNSQLAKRALTHTSNPSSSIYYSSSLVWVVERHNDRHHGSHHLEHKYLLSVRGHQVYLLKHISIQPNPISFTDEKHQQNRKKKDEIEEAQWNDSIATIKKWFEKKRKKKIRMKNNRENIYA